MSKIRTVLGDISPDQLGVTYGHEHLLWQPPQEEAGDSDLGLDSLEAAIQEVTRFKAGGGGALVEMSTLELLRSPQELKRISEATGVHIIATSGHHKEKFSREVISGMTVDEMTAEIVRDITQGMQGTSICAGVIKVGTSLNEITPDEMRVLQAAARAHRQTGAPISTHTEAGTFALEQVRLLKEAGVVSESMLIGHLDRGLPRETYRELAQSGVYLGMDQVAKEKYWPDRERAELVRFWVELGAGERILLGGDMARKSSWTSYGSAGAPGLAYILTRFVPLLKEHGVGEEAIRRILVENPKNFLAF
ncbi:MAG: phosphotriesterase-related protein [Chloroflexi bacterium]|nr:phosphotriesterase-related protein [Chloroflexota bacterium]